ncbi:HD domain-containing protein [Halovivax sp.]|uniref:HD domain-containing protein n=1 Tax=Halovivax sp. TaxID=1935978 RepID=UPI0025BD24BA|nr:HD domain-containing protein [Halovivax sp.]
MLEDVRRTARTYFDDRVGPAHDWRHVERVRSLAARLAAERDDVDETVLDLAVSLHDIGRPAEEAGEIDDHATWGAAEARRILDDRGADEGTIEAVAHCVLAHRYSNDVEPETIEARILCDADNLDALGAVGLARVFACAPVYGNPLYDSTLPAELDESEAGRTSVNHVEKKILDLPDRMYTSGGRRLAADRSAFVERFLGRFEAEVAGER